MAVVYIMLAYVVLPALWTHYEHEPGLASLPMVTYTGTGIPGDALNVGLVGSEEDVLRAMQAVDVTAFGDRRVTYAVFMRRPVISTPRLAIEFLETMAAARGTR